MNDYIELIVAILLNPKIGLKMICTAQSFEIHVIKFDSIMSCPIWRYGEQLLTILRMICGQSTEDNKESRTTCTGP